MFVGVRTLAKKLNVLDPTILFCTTTNVVEVALQIAHHLPISLELLGIR
jgi:predicted phosphoribosyltransferase